MSSQPSSPIRLPTTTSSKRTFIAITYGLLFLVSTGMALMKHNSELVLTFVIGIVPLFYVLFHTSCLISSPCGAPVWLSLISPILIMVGVIVLMLATKGSIVMPAPAVVPGQPSPVAPAPVVMPTKPSTNPTGNTGTSTSGASSLGFSGYY